MHPMKLHINWVRGKCTGDVHYIDEDRLIFVCGNYIKTCSTDKTSDDCIEGPSECISCMASDPEHKRLAVSTRSAKPVIYISQYPDLHTIHSKLENGAKYGYSDMCFSGTDYLVSMEEAPLFTIILWDWSTRMKLHYITHTLSTQEARNYKFSKHPSINELFCFQKSNGVFFFEIDDFQRTLQFRETSVYVPLVGDATGHSIVTNRDIEKLTCFDKMKHVHWGIHSQLLHDVPLKMLSHTTHSEVLELYDLLMKQERLQTTCHCWLTNKSVVLACTNGSVMLFDKESMSSCLLHHPKDPNDECFVLLMALNADGMYVAKSDNCIYLIEDPLKWELTKKFTLDLEIPMYMKFSPDFKNLAFVTKSGSVLHWNRSDNNIRCVMSNRSSTPIIAVYSVNTTHCITARKEGLIEAWNVATGELSSYLSIGDNISCMEGSPLCQMMIASLKDGYICIIDATNLNSLRTIFVSRPCDATIKLIKYENFGRFAVLVSEDSTMLFINTIPSSDFKILGYFKKICDVNDLSVLSLSLEEETAVFVLECSDDKSEHTSHVLIRMLLPAHFDTDSRNYWENQRGILNLNSIDLRKFKLDRKASSLAAYSLSSVFLYLPDKHEIKMIKIDQDQNILKRIKSVSTYHELENCKLMMSPTFDVLVSVNEDGKLFVYLADILKIKSGAFLCYCILDGIGVPCIAMSSNEKSLISGTVDGILVCHRCIIKKTSQIHTWASYIDNLKSKEDSHLSNMKESQITEVDSWVFKKSAAENATLLKEFIGPRTEILEKMESIREKLKVVVEKNSALPVKHQIQSTELILDLQVREDLMSKRTRTIQNHRRMLKDLLDKEIALAQEVKLECLENMMVKGIVLKSLRCGRPLNNYALEKISEYKNAELKHVHKKVQIANFERELRRRRSLENVRYRERTMKIEEMVDDEGDDDIEKEMEEFCNELMPEPFHLQSREQRIDYVILLKYIIFCKKMAFNKKFNQHVKHKRELLQEIKASNDRAREIMAFTREHHELWEPDYSDETSDSRFDCKDDEVKTSRQILLEKESDRMKGIASSFLNDPWVTNRKKSFEYVSQKDKLTAINLKKDMDKMLHMMQDKVYFFEEEHARLVDEKLKVDMDVYECELQLSSILFIVAVGGTFKRWEIHYKRAILYLTSQVESLIPCLTDIDNSVFVAMGKCQFLEETGKVLDREVLHMSYALKNRQPFLEAYAKRPQLEITPKNPLDPFTRPDKTISEQQFKDLFEDLSSAKWRPKKVDPNLWKQMCDVRIKKVEMEQSLAQTKQQIVQFSQEKVRLQQIKQKLLDDIELKKGLLDECHLLRLKCLWETPKVLKLKDSQIEMKYPDHLDFARALLLERNEVKVLNTLISHIGEEKLILVKVIEEAVFQFERNRSKFKKMNLDLKDMDDIIKSIGEIPSTKEVQRLIHNPGGMDPFTKVAALDKSVDMETRGLQKHIDKTNKRFERTKREIGILKRQMAERKKEIELLGKELMELKKLNVVVDERSN